MSDEGNSCFALWVTEKLNGLEFRETHMVMVYLRHVLERAWDSEHMSRECRERVIRIVSLP